MLNFVETIPTPTNPNTVVKQGQCKVMVQETHSTQPNNLQQTLVWEFDWMGKVRVNLFDEHAACYT